MKAAAIGINLDTGETKHVVFTDDARGGGDDRSLVQIAHDFIDSAKDDYPNMVFTTAADEEAKDEHSDYLLACFGFER